MANEQIQQQLRKKRQNTYLARDFDSFKADLLKYAKTYFPDKIKDFSEASMGGLFLDMNAFVGDNLSYYLDHQFRELNPNTAVETANIEMHLRNAGVKIVGASPAIVTVTFYVEVFAIPNNDGSLVPDRSILPAIRQGTLVRSTSGITFTLMEDIDFTELDIDGNLTARLQVGTPASATTNGTYILSKSGQCISGNEITDSFRIPNSFVPFRTLTLSRPNVTEIISIKDSDGNTYYEVDYLTQSNVFREVARKANETISALELIPAPYRYISETSLRTRTVTIRFGSGNAESLDDDILPDPSEVSIPLYGKTAFGRLSIDPNSLLETQSLGISPTNTTITIRYRYGGGSSHNVAPNSIRLISSLIRDFPAALDFSSAKYPKISINDFNTLAARVVSSLDVSNANQAFGGAEAPTLADLQTRINSSRFLQSRIVSRQDLLARIYTLPAKFGRVYRAAVLENPENPGGAPLVYVISKNSTGQMEITSDTLKKNLSLYLNEFRLLSDALDIMDAFLINFRIKYKVLIDPSLNKSGVLKTINTAIAAAMKSTNFQINQPIIIDDIRNVIINQNGVISLIDLVFETVQTSEDNRYAGRSYSSNQYNFNNNLINGVFIPPPGGLFELKYPNADILGTSL